MSFVVTQSRVRQGQPKFTASFGRTWIFFKNCLKWAFFGFKLGRKKNDQFHNWEMMMEHTLASPLHVLCVRGAEGKKG